MKIVQPRTAFDRLRAVVGTAGEPQPRRNADVAGTSQPAGPPNARLSAGEARAAAQLARLAFASPRLARSPRGDGSVVIDLPGWRAPEFTNIALRAWLRRLGWDARSWGLGINRGDPERDAETIAEVLRSRPPGAGQVALVGWSLGGTVAREVARHVPEHVRCVVTYGSPAVGGPTYTRGAFAYSAEERSRIDALVRQLDRDQPITVPITAIYTKQDGVVDWRACIDHSSTNVEHVEVRSPHFGLGLDPDVWWTVASALAANPGQR